MCRSYLHGNDGTKHWRKKFAVTIFLSSSYLNYSMNIWEAWSGYSFLWFLPELQYMAAALFIIFFTTGKLSENEIFFQEKCQYKKNSKI